MTSQINSRGHTFGRRWEMNGVPASSSNRFGNPVFCVGLVCFLILTFVIQQAFYLQASNGWIGIRNSVALGGLNRYLLFHHHEWWRVFTAPFIQQQLANLVCTALSLLVSGWRLERLLGWRFMLALYFAGAIAASLFAVFVGFQGIFDDTAGQASCFAGALIALSSRRELRYQSAKMTGAAIVALLLAFLPLVIEGSFSAIFNGAPQLGGLFAGFAAVTFIRSPLGESVEAAGNVALLFSASMASLVLVSFVLSALNYGAYAGMTARLLPLKDFPSDLMNVTTGDLNKNEAGFANLEKRFPNDPYIELFHGMFYYGIGKYQLAVNSLSRGLRQDDLLQTMFAFDTKNYLQEYLALALISQGRAGEAKVEMATLCGSLPLNKGDIWKLKKFKSAGVCT